MAIFFHADRGGHLYEGMVIAPDKFGLSRFGQEYSDPAKLAGAMRPQDERELLAEFIRQNNEEFRSYPSRFHCLFAAPDVQGAMRWVYEIKPLISGVVSVFEVSAETFAVYDANWLDYDVKDPEIRAHYYTQYWRGALTNHQPQTGPRREPNIEVLLKLPVVVGRKMIELIVD